jgi:hypothetical protein
MEGTYVSTMGRWDPAKKRQNYARLRLQELRKRFPHLPEDILSRVSLRDLNTAVRRAGTNQTVLPESTARSDSSNRAGSSKQKGEQRSDELQQNCLEPQQSFAWQHPARASAANGLAPAAQRRSGSKLLKRGSCHKLPRQLFL